MAIRVDVGGYGGDAGVGRGDAGALCVDTHDMFEQAFEKSCGNERVSYC
ncbi:hypothetical protein [Gimesia sp.]|nr:hypothetical protein [Gimesia sp.]